MASTKALLFTVLVAFALYWGNTFAQNEDSELAPEAMQNAQSSQGQEMRSVQSSSSMANTGNVGNMPPFSMGNTGNVGNMPSFSMGNVPPFSMGNTGNMPPFSMGNTGNMPPFSMGNAGNAGNMPPFSMGNTGNVGNMPSFSMGNTGNMGNVPPFSMGNTGNMPPFSMGNTGNMPPFSMGNAGNAGNMPPFSMGNMQLPNQDYQDQAATNQFMPSPYASQYQYSLQDLLGHMISMPWNNGQGQVPFYQNNGDVMPMPSVQMGQMQGLFPGPPVTKALAVLTTPANSSVRGMVVFTQTQQGGGLSITGNITGFRPNSTHGFHIHQYGDLSNGCLSAGSHFNPDNVTHGAEDALVRHIGDLGNIVANGNGMVKLNFTDNLIALAGRNNIAGRAVVIHEKADDLGRGTSADSLTTGNAGGRLVCGVIGIVLSE